MPNPTNHHRNEHPSTYVVQDRQSKEELTRLTIQDQLVTALMGGVLPEQNDPTRFHQVLDVGCGSAGWLLEAAQAYPSMSLIGIDISRRMIEYAQAQAEASQMTDRVEFHTMDALRMLEFPNDSFDLVNLRFGVSFLRTWDWPKMLEELQRVTVPGGIIRVTDGTIGYQTSSAALTELSGLLQRAFYQAGHLFEDTPGGLIDHLPHVLIQHACQDVQIKTHPIISHAGTEAGLLFAQDMEHLFRTVRPFLEKWLRLPSTYQTLYEQALEDMHHQDFQAEGNIATFWGKTSLRSTSIRQNGR